MKIVIRKMSLRHRSGTKEYHLLIVRNHENDNAILVNRWGKAGTWGQMKTEKGDIPACSRAFDAKYSEKEGRGYSISSDKTETFSAVDDAKSFIGMTYWPQLGADNIRHVFPDVDVSGVRETKPATWKETKDGKWERDDKPEHSMPTREDEIAEAKSNPNWGLF